MSLSLPPLLPSRFLSTHLFLSHTYALTILSPCLTVFHSLSFSLSTLSLSLYPLFLPLSSFLPTISLRLSFLSLRTSSLCTLTLLTSLLIYLFLSLLLFSLSLFHTHSLSLILWLIVNGGKLKHLYSQKRFLLRGWRVMQLSLQGSME